jgi:hypothetical protein
MIVFRDEHCLLALVASWSLADGAVFLIERSRRLNESNSDQWLERKKSGALRAFFIKFTSEERPHFANVT